MKKILNLWQRNKRLESFAKTLIFILLILLVFVVTSCQSGPNTTDVDEQGTSLQEESDTRLGSESQIFIPPAATPSFEGNGGSNTIQGANPIGRDTPPPPTITPTPTSTSSDVPELISNDISGYTQISSTVVGLPNNLETVHVVSWLNGNELALGFALRNNSSDSYLVDLAYAITPYDNSGVEIIDLLDYTTPLAERQYAFRDLEPGESIDFWQLIQLGGPVASLDSIEINFAGEALPRFQTEAMPLEILAPPVSYFEIYNINSSTYSRGDENFLITELELFNPNTSSAGVSFQFTTFDRFGNILVAVDTSYQHNLALFDSDGNYIQNNQTIIPPRESIHYVLRTFIAEPELLGAVDLAIIPGDLVAGAPYQPEEGSPFIKFYADTIEVAQDSSAVSISGVLQSQGDATCIDYQLNVYAFAFDAVGNVIDRGAATFDTALPGFDIANFSIPFTTEESIDSIYLFQEVNQFNDLCPAIDPGSNPIGRDSIPTEWSVNSVQN